MTPAEKPVFDRFTYYGWPYGLAAAGAVFGVTFGGLRFAAYRRWLHASTLPNSIAHHTRTSQSRKRYSSLDNITKTNTNKNKARNNNIKNRHQSETPPPTSKPTDTDSFSIFSDETAVQVQFMVSVALSLFVGTMSSHLYYDVQAFHRDLARVPLHPGQSLLCHQMCPGVLQQRDRIISVPTIEPLYQEQLQRLQALKQQQQPQQSNRQTRNTETNEIDSCDNNSDHNDNGDPIIARPSYLTAALARVDAHSATTVLTLDPMELWENPWTEDLESMVILVQNCQRRMDFEQECRRRDNHRVDEATGLVDVPEPGVPLQYLKQK